MGTSMQSRDAIYDGSWIMVFPDIRAMKSKPILFISYPLHKNSQ